jgi:Uma2 family endonuclease
MSVTAVPQRRHTAKVTYEEFVESYPEGQFEWIDGEVIKLTPPSLDHQDVGDFIAAVLRHFVEWKQLGIVRSAPVQMKLSAVRRGRELDVVFVSNDRTHLLTKFYVDGPADLAVEIPQHRAAGIVAEARMADGPPASVAGGRSARMGRCVIRWRRSRPI